MSQLPRDLLAGPDCRLAAAAGRLVLLAVSFAALLAASSFTDWALEPDNRLGSDDFWVYQDAASRWLAGVSPYGEGFVSPPWFVLLVLPLAHLDVATGAGIWFGANVAWTFLAALTAVSFAARAMPGAAVRGDRWTRSLVGVTRALSERRQRKLWLAAVLTCSVLWWEPHRTGLYLGQNVALLGALIGVALAVYSEPVTWRRVVAGALLAGALFKPQIVGPIACGLLVYDARSDRRPWLGAGLLGGLAVLIGLSFWSGADWLSDLLNGVPQTWDYWGSTITANTLLADLTRSPLAGWALWAPLAVGAAVAILGLWICRSLPLSSRLAATIPLTLLATPYAYSHDHFLLIFPLALLAMRAWRTEANAADHVALWLGVGALVVAPTAVADFNYRFWYLVAPAGVLVALALPRLIAIAGRRNAGSPATGASIADG